MAVALEIYRRFGEPDWRLLYARRVALVTSWRSIQVEVVLNKTSNCVFVTSSNLRLILKSANPCCELVQCVRRQSSLKIVNITFPPRIRYNNTCSERRVAHGGRRGRELGAIHHKRQSVRPYAKHLFSVSYSICSTLCWYVLKMSRGRAICLVLVWPDQRNFNEPLLPALTLEPRCCPR